MIIRIMEIFKFYPKGVRKKIESLKKV